MSEPGRRPEEAGGIAEGGLPPIDVREYGGKGGGDERQSSDRRLFMQLLAFSCPPGESPDAHVEGLARVLERRGIGAVVYEDACDPRGLALLTWSEDPSHFVENLRPALNEEGPRSLLLRPELTMLGRTYATGHEPRLEWALLERPLETVQNEAWPWAVWYPLRRTGAFSRLPPKEQGAILREHAQIGFAYGQADLAHDVRLACHGLDARDNEFVIGLVGKDLHPLSHVVQTMRRTKQTSEYIAQMGPFFVGRAARRIPARS